jgi:hypothetical protein
MSISGSHFFMKRRAERIFSTMKYFSPDTTPLLNSGITLSTVVSPNKTGIKYNAALSNLFSCCSCNNTSEVAE